MMKICLILISLSLILSCNITERKSGSNNTLQKDIIVIANDSLKIKINQLKEAYSKNNYFTFFELFPNTFNDFLELYGYDDIMGEKPLYNVCEEHINFFFNSYEFNRKEFIPKLFNVIKDAYWEADAPSYLQKNVSELIKLHTTDFVDYLNIYPDRDVKRFWHFVFGGSGKCDLQNKEKFEIIYGKINSIDKKQGDLLKEEFETMYQN